MAAIKEVTPTKATLTHKDTKQPGAAALNLVWDALIT